MFLGSVLWKHVFPIRVLRLLSDNRLEDGSFEKAPTVQLLIVPQIPSSLEWLSCTLESLLGAYVTLQCNKHVWMAHGALHWIYGRARAHVYVRCCCCCFHHVQLVGPTPNPACGLLGSE